MPSRSKHPTLAALHTVNRFPGAPLPPPQKPFFKLKSNIDFVVFRDFPGYFGFFRETGHGPKMESRNIQDRIRTPAWRRTGNFLFLYEPRTHSTKLTTL